MAESLDEVMNFIGNIPSEIEQARRSTFVNNFNSLEHWHMRLENIINLLLTVKRSLPEGNRYVQDLDVLERENNNIYRRIDNLLLASSRPDVLPVYRDNDAIQNAGSIPKLSQIQLRKLDSNSPV